jgi:hypothetical protein
MDENVTTPKKRRGRPRLPEKEPNTLYTHVRMERPYYAMSYNGKKNIKQKETTYTYYKEYSTWEAGTKRKPKRYVDSRQIKHGTQTNYFISGDNVYRTKFHGCIESIANYKHGVKHGKFVTYDIIKRRDKYVRVIEKQYEMVNGRIIGEMIVNYEGKLHEKSFYTPNYRYVERYDKKGKLENKMYERIRYYKGQVHEWGISSGYYSQHMNYGQIKYRFKKEKRQLLATKKIGKLRALEDLFNEPETVTVTNNVPKEITNEQETA